jgi:23S rRNA pseudouridine1911/1915/1917 synthase
MTYGPFCLTVTDESSGVRLDRYLSEQFDECSRAYAAQLVRSGQVNVNRHSAKPSTRLRPGDFIMGNFPPPVPLKLMPEVIPLDILYEDQDLIAVNKPAGLVVHPAPGHSSGTLVNALLHHCPDLRPIGGEIRPGIVHRLDKDTSGVLLAAKHGEALEGLAGQFRRREIQKTYLALVRGAPTAETGLLDWAIGRHPVSRKKMSIHSRRSRTAVTHWRIRLRMTGASLLEIGLETGRTHQIRVHCAAMGHPVLGDGVYGSPARDRQVLGITVSRQMLHAWRLQLIHPITGKKLSLEAPLPDDMLALLAQLDPGEQT